VKRKRAAAPKRASRPKPVTVSALIGSVAAELKRARLAFAHGTTDPKAEAAFLIGETLKIHPDFVAARATMPVTAAQQAKIRKLVTGRVRTRKPAKIRTLAEIGAGDEKAQRVALGINR